MFERFKKLRCFITGNHIYSPANLTCHYDISRMAYEMNNVCLRCGKVYKIEFPKEIARSWELQAENERRCNRWLM